MGFLGDGGWQGGTLKMKSFAMVFVIILVDAAILRAAAEVVLHHGVIILYARQFSIVFYRVNTELSCTQMHKCVTNSPSLDYICHMQGGCLVNSESGVQVYIF